MDYPSSSREKDNGSVSSDGVARQSISEDPFNNGLSFDMYAGWCSSPSNTDQMFAPFAFSPFQSMPSSYAPFDGLNFSEQDTSTFAGPDCDITGGPYNGVDKMVFQQTNAQVGFPMVSTSSNESTDKKGNSSFHQNLLDAGNCRIPHPFAPTLAEKMLRALSLVKDSSGGGILAQVWVPIKHGDQFILSTCDQPFLLDQVLAGYREVSRTYTFPAEAKPGSYPGLPGRVFISKFPEWTSNVGYYNPAEYLRVQHAVIHEVRGSIAVPVFEDEGSCCAVLELVTVKDKPNFDLEMENVCRALQVVNLRSSAPPRLYSQFLSTNQRAALAEIKDVLRAVCHAHRLPLALTWIPCCYNEQVGDEISRVRVRGGNASLNEKFMLCIENTACYVNDRDMQGFVHACAEHYLEEGQGIAGKALQSNHPFFFPDVKGYDISEYPLVHHARKFGLNAAVAIRLRSTYTGDDDYILEFFLPSNMKGSTEQQLLLNNLSGTMQRICKSLRTVTDAEVFSAKGSKVECENGSHTNFPPPVDFLRQTLANDTTHIEPLRPGVSDPKNIQELDAPQEQMSGSRRLTEKKRSSAEKHVSLSVLQQYFSGSLKDAAKGIGVCPTTLKRICRQHGISRWPSRKINKVNRSLRKIQTVLDSVQGVDGGLKFDPTTGGLVAAGSIQDFSAGGRIIFPSKNAPIRKPKSVVPSVSPPSCTDSENSTVKLEKVENYIDGNKQVVLQGRSLKVPNAETALADHCNGCKSVGFVPPSEDSSPCSYSQSKTLGAQNGSTLTLENTDSHLVSTEMDIRMNVEIGMEANDRVIGPIRTGPTSSGTTDSSNSSGSMMTGCSSSSHSFGERKITKFCTTSTDSGSRITVKATYKEDMVRFKFEPSLGCSQLYEEVAQRFKLQMASFQLKYFDDEEEWVLLVSDADLQECLEMMSFAGTRTVKFLVRDVPSKMGSSGSSNGFLAASS